MGVIFFLFCFLYFSYYIYAHTEKKYFVSTLLAGIISLTAYFDLNVRKRVTFMAHLAHYPSTYLPTIYCEFLLGGLRLCYKLMLQSSSTFIVKPSCRHNGNFMLKWS